MTKNARIHLSTFRADKSKCENNAADLKVVQIVNAISIGGKYSDP